MSLLDKLLRRAPKKRFETTGDIDDLEFDEITGLIDMTIETTKRNAEKAQETLRRTVRTLDSIHTPEPIPEAAE